ncbi:TonB-dependent receptor [Leeuwenhoekiella palythoae]|uniref:Iron complex outermembrane recepter protein n=1 Tax=Leeuwenhoekiella palythoae TaxID=573501 RepID=A0A1M5TQ02_9FLAO|nr:TonB-dependent receptor [Leeuwenhoekiella palythoae]RXG28592.1 iron complex outermembrane receptor protein [Leeuwenhoekiella palythoae]SHH52794.1 iron complex outermembrane recepter protein [Leeuwenhoekiella palythoae]
MKQLTTLLALTLLSFSMFAQQGNAISGTVVDQNGNALPNANVYLENTNYGTSSNEDGFYQISNISNGTYVLIVSEMGFKTFTSKAITINGAVTLNVKLQEDVSALDDVIISGAGKSEYVERNPSASLRLQQDLNKIPQNIQVISADVIKDQQAISMMENITRNVSGAQMIEHWGNFARINMRGFRIPPFRNGQNVLSTWGPLAEDMALVERIEVVKGPSAFMLSSGEPGGLYNVVTKKPTGVSHGEVGLVTGSYNTLRATLDVEGKLSDDNKLQYRFVGAGTTQEAHRAYEDQNRYTFAPSVKYLIDDKTSVTAQYTFQYYKTRLIGSAYVFAPEEYASLDRDFTLNDPKLGPSIMKEHYGLVNFEHQLSNNWSVSAQLAYLNYQHEGSSLWLDGSFGVQANGDLIRRVSIWDAKEEKKLGQAFVNGTAQTGGVSHKILGGLDFGNSSYIADWSTGINIDTEENPFNIYNPQPAAIAPVFDRSTPLTQRAVGYITYEYLAYYAQDELGFFNDDLRLTLAGRYTEMKTNSYGSISTDKVFTPRVAVSYSILDNLSAYAMFDQSFLPTQGADAEGNSFDPVTAEDIEGGIKYEFGDGKWNVAAGYFNITKDKILVPGPDPNYSIQIDSDVTSRGFEFDLRGELFTGLGVVLNYANTNVEDADGNKVVGFSKHITNGWFNYKFQERALEGFGVSLGYQYLVDRSTWAWGADGETDLPDYFRMDGALSWENNKFRVALNLNNLLNEYLYSGADYGSYVYWQSEPGRNFRLSLNYKF